jgi:hypothetical protein
MRSSMIAKACAWAAVILDRGAHDPAPVRDEIGHAQDAVGVHPVFGRLGGRDVRALDDQLRLQTGHAVRGQRVRSRGGDPDVARNADQRVAADRPAAGEVGQRSPGPLVGEQRLDGEPRGVVKGPQAVRGGDDSAPARGQEPGGVLPHGPEALDRDARPGQGDPSLRRGDFRRDRDPPAGGPDLVEGDAAQRARKTDGSVDLILDPGHASLVGTHVGTGYVVGERADRPCERPDQAFLVRGGSGGIGDDARLAAAVGQAGGRVLQGHGPREARDLLDRDVRGHAHAADGGPARHVVDDDHGLEPDAGLAQQHDLLGPQLIPDPARHEGHAGVELRVA